jgi:transposase-like protein
LTVGSSAIRKEEVAMERRKIRDEADAKRCLSAIARARGKTLVQWAREHGIAARSLNAWRINIGHEPSRPEGEQRGTRLVELVPAPAARARYVVRCGEMEVEVDEHFDDATLRRVLQVVAGC